MTTHARGAAIAAPSRAARCSGRRRRSRMNFHSCRRAIAATSAASGPSPRNRRDASSSATNVRCTRSSASCGRTARRKNLRTLDRCRANSHVPAVSWPCCHARRSVLSDRSAVISRRSSATSRMSTGAAAPIIRADHRASIRSYATSSTSVPVPSGGGTFAASSSSSVARPCSSACSFTLPSMATSYACERPAELAIGDTRTASAKRSRAGAHHRARAARMRLRPSRRAARRTPRACR